MKHMLMLMVGAFAGFELYRDTNNIFSRAVLHGNSSVVKYLGDHPSVDSCEESCSKLLGSCTSFTYHSSSFSPSEWAKGCYAVIDGSWQPHKEEGVTSGEFNGPTPPPTPAPCDDSLCSYNGKCVEGACHCNPEWKGSHCGELNLKPSNRKLGYQHHENGQKVTSWGGSVVVDDSGMYHMYAAEISDYCGMNVWLSNSIVIHATSPDPTTTPFTRQGVVHGIFAHEPIATRAPTGEFVVYFTAVLPPLPPPVMGGKVCEGCKDGNSVQSCGTDFNRNSTTNLPTYMVYSKDPNGPWSEPAMIPGTDVFADSNMAPVILNDGSLVGLTRGNIIRATHWKDVGSYRFSGTWHDAGEDPFVWLDKTNGVLHNIVHVNRADTHGLHYFSTDKGATWTASVGDFAFTNHMQFSDGSNQSFACRERPHIVQDAEGKIIALTNGAAVVTCHDSSKKEPQDYSYTLLQLVG